MNYLNTKDYFFNLPESQIAQNPPENRGSCRLMHLNKITGECANYTFPDVVDFLHSGDLLVLNQTKVIPARLFGHKSTGAKIEIFLLKELDNDFWQCLLRPASRLKVGSAIRLDFGLEAEVISKDGQTNVIKLVSPDENSVKSWIDKIGKMPLPPYIKRDAVELDKRRYQTVYAKEDGSVAAPTAGLHFTDELLEKLESKGVKKTFVTLHVGLGTFLPVNTPNILNHEMHNEFCKIDKESAELIRKTKERGNRIIAVGSTSVRTLESFFDAEKFVAHGEKETKIFLYPGKKFNVIDGIITNFHLPESTLIMMVAGFAGYHNTMNAYKKAVADGYNFFSYGDAMIIL